MGGYKSISGNYIKINANGDSEGNFTAYALKTHNYTYTQKFSKVTFSCNYYPVKVGEFYSERDANNGSTILYQPRVNIDWPGQYKPVDEPHCGYDGSYCPTPTGITETAAGVLGGFLLFAILLTLSLWKRWHAEQEIEGLSWKIDLDCLMGYGGMNPCPSRQSLASAMSGDR